MTAAGGPPSQVPPTSSAGTAGASLVTAGAGAGGVALAGSGGVAAAGDASAGGDASAAGAGGSVAGGGGAGVPLFNGVDLTGFAAFREPATELTSEQASAIFKVEDGAIHVYGDAPDQSTQARYTLVTTSTHTTYQLSLEYRWGTKKFAPYTDLVKYPRDAGVLFHLHGDTRQVWPASIEFQIKDGTTGDIFALYARCTSLAQNGGTTFVPADAGGSEKLVNGSTGFVQHGRSENFELPEWNQLRLVVDGGAATYWVNGHLVNQVLSVLDKTGNPVTAGPIALQAEHAEVFYRNVVIEEQP